MLSFIRIMRKKTLWFLRNESGMSLVEVMAGLVIASLLIASAGGLLLYTGRLFNLKGGQTYYQKQTKMVSDMVKEHVTYADKLKVSRSYTEGDTERYRYQLCFRSDGVVMLNGEELFGKEEGNHFRLLIENCKKPEHEAVLEYTVELLNNRNETLYSEYNVVKLVNLELNTNVIQYSEQVPGENRYDSLSSNLYLCFSVARQEEIE